MHYSVIEPRHAITEIFLRWAELLGVDLQKKIKIHRRKMEIYSHASTIPRCYKTQESENEPVSAKN